MGLLTKPSTGRGRPRLVIQPQLVSLEEYAGHAAGLMQGLWAPSTWARKQTVWRHYSQFHRRFTGAEPTAVEERTAVAFVVDAAMRVGPATARAYGQDLQAIRTKLQGPTTLISINRALGAQHKEPFAQAVTMRPATCGRILSGLEIPERTALWLQWKTCSRWDDILGLKGGQVVKLNPRELGVLFGQTKATRKNPNRQDHQLIVRHLPALPQWLRFPAVGPITSKTTSELDGLLQQFGEARPEERGPTTLTHYTAHAVKKGALDQLVCRASEKEGFPTWLIPLMAKHRSEQEQIPQVTMGYLNSQGSRLAMARLLRTAEATELLDPL
eukprot:NODE_671_length_1864_cov_5.386226_g542_i0.p2 GENE.NODE_671_length_1864_cov_5.386226_g542_i0~~NODE_671_length_1864_cov_5.386226_g542_i0.p2  ORF type:complete len:328 (+),score=5.17 NODE_671_length_1864_cov_5.386226_g542_i0:440-1423(+)